GGRPMTAGAARRAAPTAGGSDREAVEPVTDRYRLRVVQFLQDGQRRLPARAGTGQVADHLVRIADAGQRLRLVVPVPEVVEQLRGAPVRGDRLFVPSELVVDV